MLKSYITLCILSATFFSCQNNDSKIEELEKQIQMQNEAISRDKEADLKKTIDEKDAEINKLKNKKNANANSSYLIFLFSNSSFNSLILSLHESICYYILPVQSSKKQT